MPASESAVNPVVYWRHLGREHGPERYAQDIRLNPPDVVASYIEFRRNAFFQRKPNAFWVDDLIVETGIRNEKPFVIVYDRDQGLLMSWGLKHPGWMIDVIRIEEVAENEFISIDLFLDVIVEADGSYRVLDIDEFVFAIELGLMTEPEVRGALQSLHRAVDSLNQGSLPIPQAGDIKDKFWPRSPGGK